MKSRIPKKIPEEAVQLPKKTAAKPKTSSRSIDRVVPIGDTGYSARIRIQGIETASSTEDVLRIGEKINTMVGEAADRLRQKREADMDRLLEETAMLQAREIEFERQIDALLMSEMETLKECVDATSRLATVSDEIKKKIDALSDEIAVLLPACDLLQERIERSEEKKWRLGRELAEAKVRESEAAEKVEAASGAARDKLSEKLAKYSAEVASKEAEIARTNERLAKRRTELAEKKATLEALREKKASLESDYASIENDIKKLSADALHYARRRIFVKRCVDGIPVVMLFGFTREDTEAARVRLFRWRDIVTKYIEEHNCMLTNYEYVAIMKILVYTIKLGSDEYDIEYGTDTDDIQDIVKDILSSRRK